MVGRFLCSWTFTLLIVTLHTCPFVFLARNNGLVLPIEALAPPTSRRDLMRHSLTSGATAFVASFQQQQAIAAADSFSISTLAPPCDDVCLEERKRRILERRAIMQQSRTTTKRSDMFKLAQQRAKLYNTTYRGASCPPEVPCL
mmetsp:Transcript_31446/g.56974  ORF Transcript_31446/g.56974 Transcript_31446/m.56974 type:complete len:144 (+) Transcript_31446:47-478(+)